MLQKIIGYAAAHWEDILALTKDHLIVSAAALFAAVLVGIPGGYLASRSGAAEKAVVTFFSALRAVPSLAVLAFLIPFAGTGTVPAVIALTILAVPPVLLNTAAGFRGVPPFLLECAEGIGMDHRAVLLHVRIPQALPLILAGARSALCEVLASATLAARIGASGLGELIFTGLGLYRMDLLVIGGVLVASLSLASGALFDLFARALMPYRKWEKQ